MVRFDLHIVSRFTSSYMA